jgi:colanic acid/amylovoran biosynthesis protein
MSKVLLVGHSGSFNKGCEALVRSTVDIVQRHLHPEGISLMSDDPQSDIKAIAHDLPHIPINNALPKVGGKFSPSWILERVESRIIRRIKSGLPSYATWRNRRFYQNIDVVISIGGDTFSDDYEGPSAYFGELDLARRNGAFTMIWAASIGPFKRLESHWVNLLKQVDLITVREKKTQQYLQSLGVQDNLKLVADPAFLLEKYPEGTPSLPPEKIIVGLGMSAIVAEYGSDHNFYLDAFTQFVQTLSKEDKYHFILIPHVVSPDNNDLIVCEALANKLQNFQNIQIISPELNTCQMKYMISQCHYFIGARTHSTIASLSTCVPTLSIGYSAKAIGINQDIFGNTDYVLPIKDISFENLIAKFNVMVEKNKEIIDTLKKRIPEIQKKSNLSGVYLQQALAEKGLL